MNPMMVAKNRTARLVAEARKPAYSTVTRPKVREHLKVVELESDLGGRWWSRPMRESEVAEYIGNSMVSDIDCSAKCWCVSEGVYGK